MSGFTRVISCRLLSFLIIVLWTCIRTTKKDVQSQQKWRLKLSQDWRIDLRWIDSINWSRIKYLRLTMFRKIRFCSTHDLNQEIWNKSGKIQLMVLMNFISSLIKITRTIWLNGFSFQSLMLRKERQSQSISSTCIKKIQCTTMVKSLLCSVQSQIHLKEKNGREIVLTFLTLETLRPWQLLKCKAMILFMEIKQKESKKQSINS